MYILVSNPVVRRVACYLPHHLLFTIIALLLTLPTRHRSLLTTHYLVLAPARQNYTDAELFADPIDGALFEAAKARFYRELREFNVTNERCEAMCGAASIVAQGQSATPTLQAEMHGAAFANGRYAYFH